MSKYSKAIQEHFLTKIEELPGNRRLEKYEVLHRQEGWAILKGGREKLPFKFILLCHICEDHRVGDLEVGDVFVRFALDVAGIKVRKQSMASASQVPLYVKHLKGFIPHLTPEVCEQEDEAERQRKAAEKKRAERRKAARAAEAEERKRISKKYRKKYVDAVVAGDHAKAKKIHKALLAELKRLGL